MLQRQAQMKSIPTCREPRLGRVWLRSERGLSYSVGVDAAFQAFLGTTASKPTARPSQNHIARAII
jgi:hypothetical protein